MSIVAWVALAIAGTLFVMGLIGAVQICLELTRDEQAESSFHSRDLVSDRVLRAGRRRSSFHTGSLSISALILLSVSAPVAHADPAVEAHQRCGVSTQEQARRLGDSLFDQGAYQRAGECYRAAGEYALADQAFVKAVGPASAATARQLSDQRDQAKALLRKVQQAFRSER
jgi:hypothetical protein